MTNNFTAGQTVRQTKWTIEQMAEVPFNSSSLGKMFTTMNATTRQHGTQQLIRAPEDKTTIKQTLPKPRPVWIGRRPIPLEDRRCLPSISTD
jgi:hypothetical protein